MIKGIHTLAVVVPAAVTMQIATEGSALRAQDPTLKTR